MTKRTEVTLSLTECEPNALPPVCVKCGLRESRGPGMMAARRNARDFV